MNMLFLFVMSICTNYPTLLKCVGLAMFGCWCKFTKPLKLITTPRFKNVMFLLWGAIFNINKKKNANHADWLRSPPSGKSLNRVKVLPDLRSVLRICRQFKETFVKQKSNNNISYQSLISLFRRAHNETNYIRLKIW